MYTARVSVNGNWSQTSPVYCGAPGPHAYDRCTDTSGHEGNHSGGMTGSWTEEDVPKAPNTVEGVAGVLGDETGGDVPDRP